jgi:hypothetical protein
MSRFPAFKENAIDILSLAVSCLAFGISVQNCRQTDSQAALLAGQVRAYVQVSNVELVRPLGNLDGSFVELVLHLKNYGQTAAVDVAGDMDYRTGRPSQGEPNEAATRRFGPFAPGMERTVRLKSNGMQRVPFPTPRPRDDTVYFYGTVWYTDDTTKDDRHHDWCYALALREDADLNQRTSLDPCDILSYTSRPRRQD